MIDYYLTFKDKFDKGKGSNKVVILFYALKRADYVLNIQDIVGSFFVKQEIRIRDNAVRDYENGGYVITSPKTKRSIRNIPLTNKLVEELKELKEESKKIYGFKNSWYVLGYEEPMPFTRLLNRKNRNCEQAGLQQIRLHDFRHSCASLLISKGANITLVARYLGHTKIDETLNTYSHFFKSDLDSLVLTFDDLD